MLWLECLSGNWIYCGQKAAGGLLPAKSFRLQPVIVGSLAAKPYDWAEEDTAGGIFAESPSQYHPRHPERSAFYQLFETHFDSYVRAYEERFEPRSGPLRPVVAHSVEQFLSCGRLHRGASPAFGAPNAGRSIFWHTPAAQGISARAVRPNAPFSSPKNLPRKSSPPLRTGTGPFPSRGCCAACSSANAHCWACCGCPNEQSDACPARVCLNAGAISDDAPGKQARQEMDVFFHRIKADSSRPIPARPVFRCTSSCFLADFPQVCSCPAG
jgi:hypothetical protein